MKRAIYEWTAISAFSLALSCFIYWAVSISSGTADFELYLGFRARILASDGTLTLCDDAKSSKLIDDFDRGIRFDPPVAGRTGWSMPGFGFRLMNWGASPVYWVNLSLLYPASILMLMAGWCFRRCRQILAARAAIRHFRPPVVEPISHPLD